MPLARVQRYGRTWLLIVLATLLAPEPIPAQEDIPGSWCVLRRHNIYEPASCFEFYLCDTIKDTMRCGLAGNSCGVGQMGLREGWEVDPNAHPQNAPGPYLTWRGGDYVVSVLNRFGGDWYQCRGPKTMELPRRTPVGGGPSEPGFCILGKPIPQWPPNCYEFYLAAAGAGRVVIQSGVCLVTTQAAREGWTVDANMGGPFSQRGEAQSVHDRLNRFGGNFYGCTEGGPPPVPPPGGGGNQGPFDPLGRQWDVSEGDGYRYPATLTRIGNSNVFAASFDGQEHPTNQVTITITGTSVLMQRDQVPMAGDRVARRLCTYRGTLRSSSGSSDLDTAEGTFDCNFFEERGIRHNLPWRARIIGQRGQ